MRWFILRVPSLKVDSVISRLGEDHCWRPMEKLWTKPARKRKPVQVDRPLIPGWLFVQEELYPRYVWQDFDGIHGLLKFGSLGTIFVEDEELDGLRSACDYVPDTPQGQPDALSDVIAIGTAVKLRGILFGRSGVLTQYFSDGYANVDLGNMQVKVANRLISRA